MKNYNNFSRSFKQHMLCVTRLYFAFIMAMISNFTLNYVIIISKLFLIYMDGTLFCKDVISTLQLRTVSVSFFTVIYFRLVAVFLFLIFFPLVSFRLHQFINIFMVFFKYLIFCCLII